MVSSPVFESLKDAVLRRRPVLKRIIETKGNEPLLDYALSYRSNKAKVDPVRKNELIEEIRSFTASLLGKEKGESVARQLSNYYYVSTTDHHGPISHPFFVSADILAALHRPELKDATHENLIVLACSNVSLGNSSYPRSLLFHASGPEYEKIHFFSARDRVSPVFRLKSFGTEALDRARRDIESKYSRGAYSKKLKNKLERVLGDIYDSPTVLELPNFADQITVTNLNLWRRLFDVPISDLVYLELEKIVSNLIVQYHLSQETAIHRFIFDSGLYERMEKLFNGISGAFSKEKGTGTFLFWYFPEGARSRVSLVRKDTELVSLDGQYKIPLKPEHIGMLLKKQELIPSTMLSLAILSCYYGLKCLGGFSQVNYLTEIREAWDTLFDITGPKQDFEATLCGDFIIGLLEQGSDLLPATSLDFLLYGSHQSHSLFVESARNLTVTESLFLMLPELYQILYPQGEREPTLQAIDRNAIRGFLGLSGKIGPCLNVVNL